MNIDYKIGEVKLSYRPKFKNRQKVTCSEDAYMIVSAKRYHHSA